MCRGKNSPGSVLRRIRIAGECGNGAFYKQCELICLVGGQGREIGKAGQMDAGEETRKMGGEGGKWTSDVANNAE